MMKNSVSTVVIRIRSTDYTNQRQILTVRSSNGVENTKSADGERDSARTNAARPSVSVSGVSGVELVAAADEVEARLSEEVVKQSEVEVAGNGEDVRHSDLDETPSQVTAECGLREVERNGGGLDGGNDTVWRTADVAVWVGNSLQ
jgi:hypothetical protein